MRHNAIETIEQDGFTGYIIPDEDASPPWEWENLGTIAHWHRRYDIGGSDEQTTPEDFMQRAKDENLIYLPLSLLDHSGLHLYIGSGPHWSDSAGWDSGGVGFIYVTPQQVRREYGCKRITRKVREQVIKTLAAEVQNIDNYYQGRVYGYVIEDAEGEHMDSCWGFYPDEAGDGLDSLRAEIKQYIAYRTQEQAA